MRLPQQGEKWVVDVPPNSVPLSHRVYEVLWVTLTHVEMVSCLGRSRVSISLSWVLTKMRPYTKLEEFLDGWEQEDQ